MSEINTEGRMAAAITVRHHLTDAKARLGLFEASVVSGRQDYNMQLDDLTSAVASLLKAIEALEHLGADVDKASKRALS